MTYTKEQFLKAAELGEVSMIDAKHIVSLLDEVELPQQNDVREDGVEKHPLEILRNKIKNEIGNFENAATLQIRNSRLTLQDAIRSLDIQEQNLVLAKDVVRTSKVKYDQGVGSNLEVLDAETSLKEAQSNYYNAIYSAIIAKIDYEIAMGNIHY
mgnify:CR=1 FL=1